MDLNKNLDIKARRALKPPFTYKSGYIWDADGAMVADEPALRMRGWGGKFGPMENGTEIQDAVGARIAKILTENWNKA